MATSEQIKILCIKLGISVSELARLNGMSPQAFSQKMKREGFTPQDLKNIAEVANCDYESIFILSNGERVSATFDLEPVQAPVAKSTKHKAYPENVTN